MNKPILKKILDSSLVKQWFMIWESETREIQIIGLIFGDTRGGYKGGGGRTFTPPWRIQNSSSIALKERKPSAKQEKCLS